MNAIPNVNGRVPVIVLAGFFGCGKTTLLHRILDAHDGGRCAVLEQQEGSPGGCAIDSPAPTIATDGGRISCQFLHDPAPVLAHIARLRSVGAIHFERVVVETTGLADLARMVRVFAGQGLACDYRLEGIVTVVDAFEAAQQCDTYHAAREQVRLADTILVSKSDMVSPAQLHMLRARLQRMNPLAPVTTVHFGQTDIAHLRDIGRPWRCAVPADMPGIMLDAARATLPDRGDDVSSFVFRATRPFVAGKLEAVMSDLFQRHASAMLRYKGVLDVAGIPAQVIFQGMQTRMASRTGRLWEPVERRESILMFIGHDLPEGLFNKRLAQCLAQDAEQDTGQDAAQPL